MDDHPCSRRLLFLLPFPPRLDATHGGSRVMAQLVAALAPRHAVALLYLRASDEPPLDERLAADCDYTEEVPRPLIRRSWRRAARLLGALGKGQPMWACDWAVPTFGVRLRALVGRWHPEIIQAEYHIMAQYLAGVAGGGSAQILTEYEPGVRAARDLRGGHKGARRLLCQLDLLAWQRFERAMIRQVQAVVTFTEQDCQALTPLSMGTRLLCIPRGVAVPGPALNPLGQAPASLLFVGNFMHPPNVDAAMRLTQAIFPQVRRHRAETQLLIVGPHPPAIPLGKGVTVTGFVPDVTPWMERAALVVVPLRQGGGMRVKVLEALVAGKAVIASPLAAEGLGLTDGVQILLAESDEEFVGAILHLLANPVARQALAARARSWAEARLGWTGAVAAYERLYDELLGRVPGPAPRPAGRALPEWERSSERVLP